MGMILADGHLVCGRGRGKDRAPHYYVKLSDPEPAIRNLFASLVHSIYGIEAIDDASRSLVSAFSKVMTKDLQSLGKLGRFGWLMPTPRLDAVSAAAWLRSYFDGDGDVRITGVLSKCRVRAKSVNLSGLRSIQKGLKRFFGIESRVYTHSPPANPRWSQAYDLEIIRYEALQLFKKKVGFNHPKKAARLGQIVKRIEKRNGFLRS